MLVIHESELLEKTTAEIIDEARANTKEEAMRDFAKRIVHDAEKEKGILEKQFREGLNKIWGGA